MAVIVNSDFYEKREEMYNIVKEDILASYKDYDSLKDHYTRLEKAYCSILQRRNEAEGRYKNLKESIREMLWKGYQFPFTKEDETLPSGTGSGKATQNLYGFLYCIPPMQQLKDLINNEVAYYKQNFDIVPNDRLLRIYLNAADYLVEGNYTASSWKVFYDRCSYAITVLNAKDRTQYEYNYALSLVIGGIEQLEKLDGYSDILKDIFSVYALYKNLILYKYDQTSPYFVKVQSDVVSAESYFKNTSGVSISDLHTFYEEFKDDLANIELALLPEYKTDKDIYSKATLDSNISIIYQLDGSSAQNMEGQPVPAPLTGVYYEYDASTGKFEERPKPSDLALHSVRFIVEDSYEGIIPVTYFGYHGFEYTLPKYKATEYSATPTFYKQNYEFLGWYDGSDPAVTAAVLTQVENGLIDPHNFHPENPNPKMLGFYPAKDCNSLNAKFYLTEAKEFRALFKYRGDDFVKVTYTPYDSTFVSVTMADADTIKELYKHPSVTEYSILELLDFVPSSLVTYRTTTSGQYYITGWSVERVLLDGTTRVDKASDGTIRLYQQGEKIWIEDIQGLSGSNTKLKEIRVIAKFSVKTSSSGSGSGGSSSGSTAATQVKVNYVYDYKRNSDQNYNLASSFNTAKNKLYYNGRYFNWNTFELDNNGNRDGKIYSRGDVLTLPAYPAIVMSYAFNHDSNYMGNYADALDVQATDPDRWYKYTLDVTADMKNSNALINSMVYVFMGWVNVQELAASSITPSNCTLEKVSPYLIQPGTPYVLDTSGDKVTFAGYFVSVLDYIYDRFNQLKDKINELSEYDYTYGSWQNLKSVYDEVEKRIGLSLPYPCTVGGYFDYDEVLAKGLNNSGNPASVAANIENILEHHTGDLKMYQQTSIRPLTYTVSADVIEDAYNDLLFAYNSLALLGSNFTPINYGYKIEIEEFHYKITFYSRKLAEVVADMLRMYYKGDVIQTTSSTVVGELNPYVVVEDSGYVVMVHSSIFKEKTYV